MTKKTPTALPTKAEPPKEDRAALLAKAALQPATGGAAVMQIYGTHFGEQDFLALTRELQAGMRKLGDGDTRELESMLFAQAQALQSMFVNMAIRANGQEQMRHLETFARLALKAQSQSRATLEALAEIKNPRSVAFVRQANFAHGAQQVNNGTSGPEAAVTVTTPSTRQLPAAPAENRKTTPSELLEEERDGEWLDFGATCKAGAGNSDLAPVGAINGTAHA